MAEIQGAAEGAFCHQTGPPTIVREGKIHAEILQQICMIMPEAWQYPDYTIARIKYDKQEFTTRDTGLPLGYNSRLSRPSMERRA
jgi:hypothetical protein